MVAAAEPRALVEKIDKLLPTDRQEKILASILRLADTLGRTPSLHEIAADIGISLMGVRHHLVALRRKEWVNWEPNSSRSLVVASGIPFLGDVQ